jgi:hypothetical protein
MCWHRWTKWQTFEEGTAQFVWPRGEARYLYQRRHCRKCDKTELNRQIV